MPLLFRPAAAADGDVAGSAAARAAAAGDEAAAAAAAAEAEGEREEGERGELHEVNGLLFVRSTGKEETRIVL